MADLELLQSMCALVGTNGEATVEELQVLRGLAERGGLSRNEIDNVIAKAHHDDSLRDAHRDVVRGDPERALNELIEAARAAGEIDQGHASMLLWRIAGELEISPDRFQVLLNG